MQGVIGELAHVLICYKMVSFKDCANLEHYLCSYNPKDSCRNAFDFILFQMCLSQLFKSS